MLQNDGKCNCGTVGGVFGVLAAGQFGFRKLRSVEDQLLLTYGKVTQMVGSGFMVDVVFLDFS